MENIITSIENLHWKFPNKDKFVKLKNLRDFELEQIRKFIRNSKYENSCWFAIPSDKWFNDITYLLKHRRKTREILKEIADSKKK